ncbi:hypothetical protein D2962_09520 [Biomaibacter acetigenes]|uniref:Uncharacterized protein n=1 Tax=Biomaibacter acetigenes TaxID=2316383 RepID=A0A3G2R6U4_9FIRM|nr:hypothetical protein [Biomaibacter acetigenes]AYO30818.1 hypothetical protein D2962_09520 [Biomaibacter acetigenes]
MGIELNNTMNRFITQLQLIEKIIEESNAEKVEKDVEILELRDLVYAIFDRKFDEYFTQNNIEDEMARGDAREQLYSLTDFLIEKNPIMKKIYNSIKVSKDEDGEVSLTSDSPGVMSYIMERIREDDSEPSFHKKDLINQSSVISVCICLETLVSEILRDFYLNLYEGDLVENKTVTFKQMKEFGNINDARLYLIDSEIDSIFRGSFKSWFSYINDKLKISDNFKDEKQTVELINELYQRRNLFVHTDGYINDYYLKNVSKEYSNCVKKGERINADYNYIVSRIKQVERLGWIIYYQYSKLIHRDNYKRMFNDVNELLLKYMDRNCDIIPSIYQSIYKFDKMDRHSQLIAKVNYYLYYKINGRVDEIREELEAIDFSMLNNNFIMAKAIILDEEDAFEKTKAALDDVDDDDFLFMFEWPLLKLVRNKEPYKEYFKKRLNKIFEIQE